MAVISEESRPRRDLSARLHLRQLGGGSSSRRYLPTSFQTGQTGGYPLAISGESRPHRNLSARPHPGQLGAGSSPRRHLTGNQPVQSVRGPCPPSGPRELTTRFWSGGS
jgi:hypothetical protein